MGEIGDGMGPGLFSIALVLCRVHMVSVLLRVSSDNVMCGCNVILSCVSSLGPGSSHGLG